MNSGVTGRVFSGCQDVVFNTETHLERSSPLNAVGSAHANTELKTSGPVLLNQCSKGFFVFQMAFQPEQYFVLRYTE